ncbi:AAA family ATPase [Pararhodobacter sp. CCB-MM2]|uniref:AAA family ATPase n=1 Tax=Pararhodobacter sp. CCB-MM2 TaxID=1786003 RepID=UPI00082CAE18|nr:AAA family ATPase [Pararhodobacter sp. CCB-MM2]
MSRFHLLSGCSGGGKSTLLAAWRQAGGAGIEEPGRRIVRASLAGDRQGLPWEDLAGFARRAIALSLDDLAVAKEMRGAVLFDRGLVDAIAAFEAATGDLPPEADLLPDLYAPQVLMAPPWPELHRADAERAGDLSAALAEYERLLTFLPRFGYQAVILPKLPLAERLAWIKDCLA